MAEIPKPLSTAEIKVGWPRTLLLVSVFLVLVTLAVNFLLAAYENSIANQSSQLTTQIQNVAADLPSGDMVKLLTLDNQIKNLNTLLAGHVLVSPLLNAVEQNSHPQVRLDRFDLSVDRRILDISGTAPNFLVVSLETAALANAPFAQRVQLKDANFNITNNVVFDMEILLQPNYFASQH